MDKNNNCFLNIFNYRLFNKGNRSYIREVKKILQNRYFFEDFVNIYHLEDPYNVKNQSNKQYLFKINQKNEAVFYHHQNLIQFQYDPKRLPKKLYGLININIKNLFTYQVIQTILKLQSRYIKTNNMQDLVYIPHKKIIEYVDHNYHTTIYSTTISNVCKTVLFKTKKNDSFHIKFLLPPKHFIYYQKIKYCLNYDLYLSDIQLSNDIELLFKIKLSPQVIYNTRKRYLIPAKEKRDRCIYCTYEQFFSKTLQLTSENIKHLEKMQGVYELLSEESIQYDYSYSNTIYIGSSQDIRKRMRSYLFGDGHTQKIQSYLQKHTISFRFIQSTEHKILEKDIFNAFKALYGNSPLLNTNRVL